MDINDALKNLNNVEKQQVLKIVFKLLLCVQDPL